MKRLSRYVSALVVISIVVLATNIVYANPYDLGGRTVKIGWFDMKLTPFYGLDLNWAQPDGRLKAHLDRVQEMFNCTIEFTTWQGFHNPGYVVAEVLTGNPNFDLYMIMSDQLPILVAEGVIYPIGDVLDDEYWARFPLVARDPALTKVLGRHYALDSVGQAGKSGLMLHWNMDMFAQFGFPDLYEVYESGDWTWDIFREIAVDATRDTDGDGEVDQWGLGTAWNFAGYLDLIALTNNGRLVKEVDGRVEVAFDEPAMIETLEFWQQLVHHDKVVAPSGGLLGGKVAMWIEHTNEIWMYQDLPDTYGVVPLPRGPRADRHISPNEGGGVLIMPISVQNPRAIAELWNALFMLCEPYFFEEQNVDLENRLPARFQSWLDLAPDRESYENIRWGFSNRVIVDYRQIIADAGFRTAAWQVVSQGGSVPGAMAAIKPAAQAILDEMAHR